MVLTPWRGVLWVPPRLLLKAGLQTVIPLWNETPGTGPAGEAHTRGDSAEGWECGPLLLAALGLRSPQDMGTESLGG